MDVDIELDTEPREMTVPPGLREALDRDARRFFEGLFYNLYPPDLPFGKCLSTWSRNTIEGNSLIGNETAGSNRPIR